MILLEIGVWLDEAYKLTHYEDGFEVFQENKE
jgi:hypothetical protein